MLLLLISIAISPITAKTLTGIEDFDGNDLSTANGIDDANYFNNYARGYVIREPLWVLRLSTDGWMDSKLALGTSEDQEDFYNAVAPMTRQVGVREISTKVLNENAYQSNKTEHVSNGRKDDDKDLINDITKLINKFALSTNIEPDSYLSGNGEEKDPSIAIYFKGPFTCLIVILGEKQWHYILQTPPFPAWFYENHDTYEAPIKIPDNIRYTFLQILLKLLKLILSDPL